MADQFNKLAQNFQTKIDPKNSKWYKQPMLFYIVLLIIIGTIVSLSLAATDNNETATTIFAISTFVGLMYLLFSSSNFGHYGKCAQMAKLTN